MTEGDRFINKCTNTKIDNVPWPHQIIKDTLHLPVFEKLKTQCEKIYNTLIYLISIQKTIKNITLISTTKLLIFVKIF